MAKMETQSLKSAFLKLTDAIRTVADENLSNGLIAPSRFQVLKVVPYNHGRTETGVCVNQWNNEFVFQESWANASAKLLKIIKSSAQFRNFCDQISTTEGRELGLEIEDKIRIVIERFLAGEILRREQIFDFLIKAIRQTPVPATCTINVYGVSVKGVQNVSFSLDSRRIAFRQLEVKDFEHESQGFEPNGFHFGMHHSSSILTIEMNAWRPFEFQIESKKAIALLHLFDTAPVRFGREAWSTPSPFALLKGAMLATPNPHIGNRSITLTAESAPAFQKFWTSVEPRLPAEFRDFDGPKNTPLAIAYERYCDSVFTNHPIERRIAFAIMGMEAIYLQENEVQELMYRIQLRTSKIFSKIGFRASNVRDDLKVGYRIRNLYVHGGHLSSHEKGKIEKKGTLLSDLADRLLDYLRMSILHLVLSKQSKDSLLDLVEDSLIDRSKDDALQSMFDTEIEILRACKNSSG